MSEQKPLFEEEETVTIPKREYEALRNVTYQARMLEIDKFNYPSPLMESIDYLATLLLEYDAIVRGERREGTRGDCTECGWAGMVWIVVFKGNVQGAFASKALAEEELASCLKQDANADVRVENVYIDPVYDRPDECPICNSGINVGGEITMGWVCSGCDCKIPEKKEE